MDRPVLPPVVTGSLIIVIGLKLAPVAMDMAMTRVYSVWVIGGAAVMAIVLSFIQKFGPLIGTIPVPVMGGISMMLFGIIASAGIRTLVESGVNYGEKRHLTISSVILVVGIGGGVIQFPLASGLDFTL